jgi:selenide,water dikinase
MQGAAYPVTKDLVLLGGGHSHVAVLKAFGMAPVPGLRLTLICRDAHTPYSGMLPGFVAGHYDFDDAHIDLGPLTVFAGARFLHDEAVGLDLANRRVLCRDRPPVAFDLLSINIGSAPATDTVPGASDTVVPVKPINRFIARWEALRERVLAHRGRNALQIGVVGAGAGGVEILLAVQHRLRELLAAEGRDARPPQFHLFTDTADILPTHNARVRRKFRRVLGAREVAVHSNFAVTRVAPGRVFGDGEASVALDEILWVTAAGAAPWLQQTGLALDQRGFVAVHETLQSQSHPEVFAAGDIAAVMAQSRPKSGVFAVRQGRPLADNLRRAALGQPLRAFQPQRRFLSIIATGERYAIASRGSLAAEGAWVWRWKDRIDRRFMATYNRLPDMAATLPAAPAAPAAVAIPESQTLLAALAMRCGGCGAKVATDILARTLARLRPMVRPDVLIGLDQPDDAAALIVPPGKILVQTVDFFRALIDDPYLFGRIAANHALGDIYAMGAEPHSALALASVPPGTGAQVEETLFQMMAGAVAVLNAAGAALIGGHSGEGAELALGFAVNGLGEQARLLRKTGLRPGDKLILTKPLGTGTLFAAHMRAKAKGRWIDSAVASMLLSNGPVVSCFRAHGASACTDVTGFGLLGHLLEMTMASGVGASLELGELPMLDGALECAAAGIVSSLQPANLRLAGSAEDPAALRHPSYPLLFDPQTAGGLLAGIPADRAPVCLDALRALGYAGARVVGTVLPAHAAATPVRLIV